MMARTVPSVDIAANRLIRRLLAALLDQAPYAALVCLNVIDADDKQWELDRRYFRVTNGVGLRKRQDALVRRMPPVPNWESLLPLLRDGRCPLLRVADLQTGPMPQRLPPTATSDVLVCPVADLRGDLMGAILIVLDRRHGSPRGAKLKHLAAAGARAGGQIAAVLALGGRSGVRMSYPQTA
jgi:hypothetical protein